MKYIKIQECPPIHIAYKGPPLDLISIGIVEFSLAEILEKIAHRSLAIHGGPLYAPSFGGPGYVFSRRPRLIRAEIDRLSSGSVLQDISLCVSAAFSDPFTLAILSNLGSDMIYAIARSGVRNVFRLFLDQSEHPLPPAEDGPLPPISNVPFEIGPNLREMIMAISENSDQGASVSISTKETRTTRQCELRIEVPPHNATDQQ